MNKRLKRLFSFCTANFMLMNMLPVTGLAADRNDTDESTDRSSYVFTEDDNAILQQDVFAKIEVVENQYSSEVRGGKTMSVEDYVEIIPKVKKAIKSSDTYVSGSLTENGDFLVWETTLGVTCCYSPRMEEKINNTDDDPTSAQIAKAEAEAKTKSIRSALNDLRGGYPDTAKVALIQPFWESADDNLDKNFCLFSPSYKTAWEDLCEITGTEGIRHTLYDANINNIADTMEECGFVVFDSHGDTDYYDRVKDDATSQANSSYLVITTATGLSGDDFVMHQGEFGEYANAMVSDGYAFVNGSCIASHMDKKAPHSMLYMAQCLGMATDGMFTGLQDKGVEAFWGYSQSVTFIGETAYMLSVTEELGKNSCLKDAAACAKETYGDWDPAYGGMPEEEALSYQAAFPVVVSSEDEYPGHGNVDCVLPVNSTWTLFKQYNITAVSGNENGGTVSLDGRTITAAPASGYAATGYTVLSGTAEVEQDGLVFTVDPSSDCTVQINFTPAAPAVIKYVADGETFKTENVKTGDTIILPGEAPRYNGWTLDGWTTDKSFCTRSIDRPDDIMSGGDACYVSGDKTFYAVYSMQDPDAEVSYKKMTSVEEITDGRYVLTYADCDDMIVAMTGLSNNQSYNESRGATAFADTGMTLNRNLLSNVSDEYLFDLSFNDQGFTFRNVATRTYLSYSNILRTLYASSVPSNRRTNWTPEFGYPYYIFLRNSYNTEPDLGPYLSYSKNFGFYIVGEPALLFLWKEVSPVIYATSPSGYGTVTLNSANVSLDSGLIMNYRFYIPDMYSENGVKAVIVGPGGKKTVDLVNEGGSDYKASYPVKAIYANQPLTVSLIDNSGAIVPFEIASAETPAQESLTYGIYDYFESALYSGLLTDEETKQVKAAYTYCAYAVKWKSGNTIPNSRGINALPDVKAEDLEEHNLSISGANDKVAISSISLLLDSNTAFRVYFTCSDDIKNHTITIDGSEAEVTASGSRYCVTLKDIYANSLQTRHTLTIDNMTVSFDTLSYVYSALKNGVANDLNDVVKAFYAYSECFKNA